MITNSLFGYSGRLGNQLFQFSFLYILKLLHSYDIKISLDNLIDYNHELNKANLFSIFSLDKKYLAFGEKINVSNIINKWGIFYDNNIFDIPDSSDVRGNFQAAQYYYPYRKELLELYKFSPNIYKKSKQYIDYIKNNNISKEIVAVHVRRTDYIDLKNQLDIYYYLNIMNKYFYGDKYEFIYISDDIEWCKKNFPMIDYFSYFCEGVDLCLLSLSDHIISANSTFSWWGIFLNKNEGKFFMPKKWFSDYFKNYYNIPDADESALILENAIVIDN